jgi:hypothetical protein
MRSRILNTHLRTHGIATSCTAAAYSGYLFHGIASQAAALLPRACADVCARASQSNQCGCVQLALQSGAAVCAGHENVVALKDLILYPCRSLPVQSVQRRCHGCAVPQRPSECSSSSCGESLWRVFTAAEFTATVHSSRSWTVPACMPRCCMRTQHPERCDLSKAE